MLSWQHAVVGTVVSVLGALVLFPGASPPSLALLVGYGVAVSVFVDLDHFLIARAKTGSWRYLTRALRNPVWAFTAQEQVFPDVSMPFERLASHLLIGAALVVGFAALGRLALAWFTAAVVWAHVLGDASYEAWHAA